MGHYYVLEILPLKSYSENEYLFPCFFKNSIVDDTEDEIENTICLTDVHSYTVQFPNDNFNAIQFKFRQGGKLEYTFFQKNKYEGDTDSMDVINAFHDMIRDYNAATGDADKILFKPSFYGTNSGLFVIIGLTAFLIFGIFLYTFYSKKDVPLTYLLSFILIVQLANKRFKELEYYKKVSGTGKDF